MNDMTEYEGRASTVAVSPQWEAQEGRVVRSRRALLTAAAGSGGALLLGYLLHLAGVGLPWIVIAPLLLLLVVVAVPYLLHRLYIEPIERLAEQIEGIAAGVSLHHVESPSPAFAPLVDDINRMTERMRGDLASIRMLTERLETAEKYRPRAAEMEELYTNAAALSEVGRQIISSLSLEEIVVTTYENVNAMMDAAGFGIGILDERGESLHFARALQQGTWLPEFRNALSDPTSLTAWVARNRRGVYLNDVGRDAGRYVDTPPSYTGRSSASTIIEPLCIGERVIGVLCVESFRVNAYSEHHVQMVRTLAAYTAIAHDHAAAYHELNRAHQELKEAQQQLVQSEKMASLGQLTAGIAHEINNPINFVSANVKPLQRDIDDILGILRMYDDLREGSDIGPALARIDAAKREVDLDYIIDEMRQLLRGIEEGAGRTAEIVRGLRNFSRLDESALKRIDLHEGIDSTLVLLHSTYKGRIELVKEYGTLPAVECYPSQINQVFMNLLTNAIQAISEEGRITIRTRAVGETIEVAIADTGTGMDQEVRAKIFDPFFTTKDVGKGTGLGLSISHGIIEKHHGAIAVASRPGEGTTFTITLPVTQPNEQTENGEH